MSTYKLTFKNRLVVTIADVLSETEVDAEVYDLTNYRDDISGGGGSLSHVATAYTDNADNIDNAADATSTALPSVLYRKASAPY
jgi:CO dehydrogenase/acetyl-CoA synthase gamma subunit (corrinoid Fe-S protein)